MLITLMGNNNRNNIYEASRIFVQLMLGHIFHISIILEKGANTSGSDRTVDRMNKNTSCP